MRDPKAVIRDLENACGISPRVTYLRDGSSERFLPADMWGVVWHAMNDAREVIEYLLQERDSLLELLNTEEQNADHI